MYQSELRGTHLMQTSVDKEIDYAFALLSRHFYVYSKDDTECMMHFSFIIKDKIQSHVILNTYSCMVCLNYKILLQEQLERPDHQKTQPEVT